MKIKVEYDLDDNNDFILDNKIREGLESVGFEWYAQGVENNRIRDRCFDYKDEKLDNEQHNTM